MTIDDRVCDGQLLREFARSGGDAPFAELVRRHAPLVLGVCRGVLGGSADAEDAAQAAFLALAQKASALTRSDSIAGWMHRVAWHIAMRAREARQRRTTREREAATTIERRSAPEASGDEPMIDLLNEELDKLPEKYRLPLILHHLQGWSEPEAAALLGCRVGTVSGRLSRGRQMLRERMSARRGSAARVLSIAAVAAMFADQATAGEVPASFTPNLLAAVTSNAGAGARVSAHVAALAQSALHRLLIARIRVAVILAAIALSVGVAGTIIALHASNRAVADVAVPAGSGDIHGKLLDASGAPVSGATVRLYGSRQLSRARNAQILVETTSRDDGSFTITDQPAANTYYVLAFVTQPTFMHGEADVKAIGKSQVNDIGIVRMQPGRY